MEKIKWYSNSVEDVENVLKTDIKNGLSNKELKSRYEKYGYNKLKDKKQKTLLEMFVEQFKDFMIIVLIIAAVVSGAVGVAQGEGIADSIIILIIVVLNAIVGVVQEGKAAKSLEALKKMSSYSAKVIRDGKLEVVPSEELVPGDIVELETGDFVPADLRIIEAVNLKSQEAALTGESLPVEKQSSKIDNEDISIGDRVNMLFSSSLITYGRGKGIVVETGMNTEVGKIATIISETDNSETPLKQKLETLGKTLGIVALIICIVIFVVGILYGKEVLEMFMTAVSLAVAAIPEGLPAISTIVLAIGVQRMVKRNAIVRTLPSVETLGSATVICSDKTGTLTQNKMTVEKVYYNNELLDLNDIKIKDNVLDELLLCSVLCNDAKITKDNENVILTGDPTETALIDLGLKLDVKQDEIEYERFEAIPFDSDRKLMTTVNKKGDKYFVYTKGAVDELLRRCVCANVNGNIVDVNTVKKSVETHNENMAKAALRVLGFAYKELEHVPSKEEMKAIESDLIFVGMVGMIDPPRPECKEAVEKCKTAGIKPVMITGDHKITAIAIAKSLGILENEDEAITGAEVEKMSQEELEQKVRNFSVYARVSPEHKVRIVKAWQANKQSVAMTGDGVNDAPALKTADIGAAMGIVGTDVAKEAADVVLTDDNFATIVSAVEEGRRIYDNILKAIQFLISSNIGEIIILFVAILITPLLVNWFGVSVNELTPLLPIHILWINLVTDSLPALALSVDPAAKNIMNRKPNKPQKGIFTKGMVWRIVYQGIMVGCIALAAFIIGLATPEVNSHEKIKIAQTMTFAVLALSQLTHVFNIRDNKNSIFKTGIFDNMKLILADIVSAGLMLVALLVPQLHDVFGIANLPKQNILEVILLVIAPIIIVEIFKLFKINTLKDEE